MFSCCCCATKQPGFRDVHILKYIKYICYHLFIHRSYQIDMPPPPPALRLEMAALTTFTTRASSASLARSWIFQGFFWGIENMEKSILG